MSMRAIIAGGGTGGHIIPGLAIARALQQEYGAEVMFIGTPRGLESKLVPQAGFPLRMVNIGALKGVSIARRLRTLFDLPRAVFAAGRMIREFRADIVVGVGGYASGPAMIAAVVRGVPTLAFESNRVPGFANRAVASFVSAAAVHFEETAKYFRNAQVTGVPVRTDFFQAQSQRASHSPTILVTGGSQGAKALNKAFREAAPELVNRMPNLRIIHQTGERDLADTKAAYEKAGIEAEVSAFVTDMPAAFAKADLILCRSGASTVAEIAAAGKAAIFVPFPFATDDHQKRNAEALSTKGAALLLVESELTPERLANEVSSLMLNANRLQEMSATAKTMAHPEAARAIARLAAELVASEQRMGH
jgi:UDP-N-acetylglucosamine--N-acetylmuramyl-(pentapeptide) pyrophosphoryl-undecaprenol N-acetylglucosamine transferase